MGTSVYGKFQMVVCTTYIMLGLACLATALSLIQEGLMLKAERMKNKMGLGKSAKVRFDDVAVRDRVARDSSGYFIGLDIGPDSQDPVTSVGDPTEEDDSSRPQTARTEVPDDEEAGDIPGQVDAEEGDEEEAAEEDHENDGENEDNAEEQERLVGM